MNQPISFTTVAGERSSSLPELSNAGNGQILPAGAIILSIPQPIERKIPRQAAKKSKRNRTLDVLDMDGTRIASVSRVTTMGS